jgi:hypothetical protein
VITVAGAAVCDYRNVVGRYPLDAGSGGDPTAGMTGTGGTPSTGGEGGGPVPGQCGRPIPAGCPAVKPTNFTPCNPAAPECWYPPEDNRHIRCQCVPIPGGGANFWKFCEPCGIVGMHCCPASTGAQPCEAGLVCQLQPMENTMECFKMM